MLLIIEHQQSFEKFYPHFQMREDPNCVSKSFLGKADMCKHSLTLTSADYKHLSLLYSNKLEV